MLVRVKLRRVAGGGCCEGVGLYLCDLRSKLCALCSCIRPVGGSGRIDGSVSSSFCTHSRSCCVVAGFDHVVQLALHKHDQLVQGIQLLFLILGHFETDVLGHFDLSGTARPADNMTFCVLAASVQLELHTADLCGRNALHGPSDADVFVSHFIQCAGQPDIRRTIHANQFDVPDQRCKVYAGIVSRNYKPNHMRTLVTLHDSDDLPHARTLIGLENNLRQFFHLQFLQIG